MGASKFSTRWQASVSSLAAIGRIGSWAARGFYDGTFSQVTHLQIRVIFFIISPKNLNLLERGWADLMKLSYFPIGSSKSFGESIRNGLQMVLDCFYFGGLERSQVQVESKKRHVHLVLQIQFLSCDSTYWFQVEVGGAPKSPAAMRWGLLDCRHLLRPLALASSSVLLIPLPGKEMKRLDNYNKWWCSSMLNCQRIDQVTRWLDEMLVFCNEAGWLTCHRCPLLGMASHFDLALFFC